MSKVTLGGNPIDLAGSLPQAGATAPDFQLAGADLGEVEEPHPEVLPDMSPSEAGTAPASP